MSACRSAVGGDMNILVIILTLSAQEVKTNEQYNEKCLTIDKTRE